MKQAKKFPFLSLVAGVFMVATVALLYISFLQSPTLPPLEEKPQVSTYENLYQKKITTELTPYFDLEKLSVEQVKALNTHVLQNSMEIFSFRLGEIKNPFAELENIIQLSYKNPKHAKEQNLLNTAQIIDTVIHKSLKDAGLANDFYVKDKAIRINPQKEPYPFIILELTKNDEISKKAFLENFNKNLAVYKGKSRYQIRIIDEESFLYCIYNNTISHIIRLQPRQERMPYASVSKVSLKTNYTLVLDDVGENFTLAKKFMDLPIPMVFSIWPHSTHATRIATVAYEKGIPIFLHQPMEAKPYKSGKQVAIGSGGLYTGMTQVEMEHVLRDNFLSVPHARGLNNHMGSKFTADKKAVSSMLSALKEITSHFIILDSYTNADSVLYEMAKAQGFLTERRNYFIDNTNANIEKMLKMSMDYAKDNQKAYVIGHARTKTYNALKKQKFHLDSSIVYTLPTY